MPANPNLFLQTPTNPGTALWGAGGGGTVDVEDEGVLLGPADTLNFAGAGVAVVLVGAEATITIPGGGAGVDTYTPPNEYYVDPALPVDATKRQYTTIAGALAAAQAAAQATVDLRLVENVVHPWDGTGLAGSVAAAGAVVTLWCEGSTTVEFALATTLSSDGFIRFQHLVLDCDANGAVITLGTMRCTVEECGGQFNVETTDQPTPVTTMFLDFFRSYMNRVAVLVTAGDTNGFSLFCQDCEISLDIGGSFFDASAAVAPTFAEFRRSELIYSGGVGPVFLNDAGNNLAVNLNDTLLSILGGGVTIMTGGTNGVSWIDGRIVSGDGEGGGNWFFGNVGQASGLSIDNYASSQLLSTDAPGNTLARSSEYGGLFFKRMTSDETQSQWRGDGDAMYMQASLAGAAPQTDTMVSIIDGTDTIFFDPTTKKTFRIQGTVIFSVTGATNDTSVFDVDITLRVAAAAFTVLAGGAPTIIFENNAARYVVTLLPVINSGLQIVVDKTASAENPQIRANFFITECPSTP